jgi:3-hydroxyacyl-[acyl-carrier-protein] dehydratase
MQHRLSGEISPEHPALPGHFPGNPIVPGVLLLSRVAQAVRSIFGSEIIAVPAVKFHVPLRPAERFEIELYRAEDDIVKFRVARGKTLIASGSLRLKLPIEANL